MLTIVVVLYIFLIFPIFTNINVRYSKNVNMLEYQIKLFSFITILFGYIELIDEAIVIHINNKKAVLIFYKDLFSIRKKFKPLRDYHIFKLNTNIKFGYLGDGIEKINFFIIYNFIFNMIGQWVGEIKPYLSLKSNIMLCEKENTFIFRVRSVFVFNMLMVLISLIKIFLEKIIYAVKSRT